jgi:hypothetical protein
MSLQVFPHTHTVLIFLDRTPFLKYQKQYMCLRVFRSYFVAQCTIYTSTKVTILEQAKQNNN